MEKLILNAFTNNIPTKGIIVRIDNEASAMLNELEAKTGETKKDLVSKMIKFCYPNIEIQHTKINMTIKEVNI